LITRASGWKPAADTSGLGWETTFQRDLNGDEIIGIPLLPPLDSDQNGLLDGSELYAYQIFNGGSPLTLRNNNGGTYFDGSTSNWDALAAVADPASSGFQVLLQGTNAYQGQYYLWTTDDTGLITRASGWKLAEDTPMQGWEVLFQRDLDGDSQITSLTSPLVLDLDGDGITTLAADLSAPLSFDLDANGFSEVTGWLSSLDAFLALDRNGDGAITSGAELFGNATVQKDGGRAANGFQALAEYDFSADGVIDANDPVFQSLLLWQDRNSNAVSEIDEITGLAARGIRSIDLNYVNQAIVDNGNFIRESSSFDFASGGAGLIADVWFASPLPSVPSDPITGFVGSPLSADVAEQQQQVLTESVEATMEPLDAATGLAGSVVSPLVSPSTPLPGDPFDLLNEGLL